MMDIVFLGMNEAGQEVLQWLKKDKTDVEVKKVIKNKEQIKQIEKIRPDLVVSSGFKHIIPKELINIPEKGIVNLHPSYLPYNRGAHPYIWPLINDTPAGVSIHFMTESLDQGPIIARKKVDKKPIDNSKTLRDRLMREQAELFKQSWEKILEGKAKSQDIEKGSVNRKKDLDDISNLDLDKKMSLREAINLLRGLTYGDKFLGSFSEKGRKYSVGVEIKRQE